MNMQEDWLFVTVHRNLVPVPVNKLLSPLNPQETEKCLNVDVQSKKYDITKEGSLIIKTLHEVGQTLSAVVVYMSTFSSCLSQNSDYQMPFMSYNILL